MTRRRQSRDARFATFLLTLLALLVCGGVPVFALPTLEEVMGDFGLQAADAQRVRKGELVKTIASATAENEIAAVMVFRVDAPVSRLIEFFEVGSGFRNDPQIKSATEITGEGTLDDFKSVVLEPGGDKEAKRYLDAAPGDVLNLSPTEIATFQKLKKSGNTSQADVEVALRQMLLARYQAYRTQGLTGIALYARAKGAKTQPAADLRRATEAAPAVMKYARAFYDVLLGYPRIEAPGLVNRFFAIHYQMSGRPNFTLRHRMAMPIGEAYVIADREFYVAHDYNQTQAIAALVAVEGGTMVVYVNRTTTDQLGGFGASAKQAIGSSMMASQISAIFEKNRAAVGDK